MTCVRVGGRIWPPSLVSSRNACAPMLAAAPRLSIPLSSAPKCTARVARAGVPAPRRLHGLPPTRASRRGCAAAPSRSSRFGDALNSNVHLHRRAPRRRLCPRSRGLSASRQCVSRTMTISNGSSRSSCVASNGSCGRSSNSSAGDAQVSDYSAAVQSVPRTDDAPPDCRSASPRHLDYSLNAAPHLHGPTTSTGDLKFLTTGERAWVSCEARLRTTLKAHCRCAEHGPEGATK